MALTRVLAQRVRAGAKPGSNIGRKTKGGVELDERARVKAV